MKPTGGITAVAIVSFIFGAVNGVTGLSVLMVGPTAVRTFLSEAADEFRSSNPDDMKEGREAVEQVERSLNMILCTAGTLLILFAALLVIAGFGIMKRRQWGRTLTLGLGTASGVLALLSLVKFNVGFALIYGAYGVAVYIVLLNKTYIPEFRRTLA
jgi:Predicted membrane protein (DUF2127)